MAVKGVTHITDQEGQWGKLEQDLGQSMNKNRNPLQKFNFLTILH